MAHFKTYHTENKIQTLKQAQAQEGSEHKLSKCVGMVIYGCNIENMADFCSILNKTHLI